MTNTIHNVPRELLERLANTSVTDYEALGNNKRELRSLLSAPSPAGVDGCKCSMSISMLGDGCRHCQPQEYIDRLSEMLDEERDQQAQRIGELEGLLRAESARVDFLDAHIVTADAPNTGKVAMLADSGTLRECIAAALSTGKEGE